MLVTVVLQAHEMILYLAAMVLHDDSKFLRIFIASFIVHPVAISKSCRRLKKFATSVAPSDMVLALFWSGVSVVSSHSNPESGSGSFSAKPPLSLPLS